MGTLWQAPPPERPEPGTRPSIRDIPTVGHPGEIHTRVPASLRIFPPYMQPRHQHRRGKPIQVRVSYKFFFMFPGHLKQLSMLYDIHINYEKNFFFSSTMSETISNSVNSGNALKIQVFGL